MHALLLLWTWARATAVATGVAASSLVEDHKAVRRLIIIWATSLITWVTWQLFHDPTTITAPGAAAYASVTALLTAAIGLYQWTRAKEEAAAAAADASDSGEG